MDGKPARATTPESRVAKSQLSAEEEVSLCRRFAELFGSLPPEEAAIETGDRKARLVRILAPKCYRACLVQFARDVMKITPSVGHGAGGADEREVLESLRLIVRADPDHCLCVAPKLFDNKLAAMIDERINTRSITPELSRLLSFRNKVPGTIFGRLGF